MTDIRIRMRASFGVRKQGQPASSTPEEVEKLGQGPTVRLFIPLLVPVFYSIYCIRPSQSTRKSST